MRGLATLAVALAIGAPAWGQSSVSSAAVPPSDSDLARVRLKTEWTVHLPIDSRRDSVVRVQVVDGGQVYAQTRSGHFVAHDARTGQRLWSYHFPTGRGSSLPIAVNSRYVFAVNLSTLYCFHRHSGILEFAYEPTVRLDIPLATITSGPVCDETYVYVVLGAQEVLGYRLPTSVTQPDPVMAKSAEGLGRQIKPKNPADEIAQRYPGQGKSTQPIDPPTRSRGLDRPEVTGNPNQRSPSIGVLPSVTMPYEFKDRNGLSIQRTESLTLLNTLRHPYQIYDGERRYVVKTPSVTVIPPSVARAYELNDIRPKGVQPTKLWRYEATSRIAFEPVLAGPRMWVTFESPRALAIDRLDLSRVERVVQTDGVLSAAPATGLVADGSAGYLALADGSVVSVDLAFGGTNNMGALKQMWRANVGGTLNRVAMLTPTSVFVGGTASGVGRVDRKAGELTLRTASDDDFLLAVSDESAFTRDRNGTVRVYDLAAPTDPVTRRGVAVGELALGGFGLPVTNAVTDRVFLAADNGLLVCLRDAAPKYAVPRPNLPAKKDAPKPAAPAGDAPAGSAPAPPPMTPPVTPAAPATTPAPAPATPPQATPPATPPKNDKKPGGE